MMIDIVNRLRKFYSAQSIANEAADTIERLGAENTSLEESVLAKDLQIASLKGELSYAQAGEKEAMRCVDHWKAQADDLAQQLAAAKDEANTARVEAECLAASCKSVTEQLAAANGREARMREVFNEHYLKYMRSRDINGLLYSLGVLKNQFDAALSDLTGPSSQPVSRYAGTGEDDGAPE